MATIILEHSDRAGSRRLGETLQTFGHQLRVIQLHRGEPVPPDLNEVDAVVTCGGAASACDETIEWRAAELEFLREAHESGCPVVGVCLGSQLLALALGGEVEPMEGGIELGWHPVSLNPMGREDALHRGIGWTTVQPHWHRDSVTKLPEGGRVLASSPRCPIQAWSMGLRTYGFQYHPEIHEDTLDLWAAESPEDVRESGTSLEELRRQTEEHYPTCARLADRLFESLAMLLIPVDRRYQGVTKDLHH